MELRGRITGRQANTRAIAKKNKRTGIKWHTLPWGLFFGVVIIVSICLISMSVIEKRTEIAKMGVRLYQLEALTDELQAERDSLKLQLMPYTKQSRIEEIATETFAMTYEENRTANIADPLVIEPVAVVAEDIEQNPTLLGELTEFVYEIVNR